MTLESQCTSLELSKRLAELKVAQSSLFYWVEEVMGPELIYATGDFNKDDDPEVFYSAFSASELGEMLPDNVAMQRKIVKMEDGTEALK